jgi:hypothetical protein
MYSTYGLHLITNPTKRNQEYFTYLTGTKNTKVLCKTTHFYISRLKSLMSFPFKKLEAQPTESVLLT